MEVIAHAALRAAMDDERDRIFFALVIVPRLHHVTVHDFLVPAGKTELFVVAAMHAGETIGVAIGESLRPGLGAQCREIPIGRRVEPVERIDAGIAERSGGRRVWKGCVRTWRGRWTAE